ncbi:MAG: AbrB/MazE/SpoVT family DNA-binding domain-containing protein [Candidatus Hodarchaeaceae archaeon]|nr:AbrB/MazE/SpoVT family DNA-binding domain-containing protein [Candidatus Hodarchaeaceae archaeon]
MVEEKTVSISSKGQVVIPKALRRKYRIEKGTKLLLKESQKGILLTVQRPMAEDVKEIARELRGKWPRGMTAVEIVRRERGKHG